MLKFIEHFSRQRPLSQKVKGTVVDNDDPLRRQRVKCRIPGVFSPDVAIADLPWCFPQKSIDLGGSSDVSSMMVPNIGSTLIIEFPFGDVYSPFYVGVWISDDSHPGIYDEDYPASYGFRDEQGTWWKVNRTKRYAEFQHTSGSGVKFKSDGQVDVISDKGVKFVSTDGATEVFLDLENGTLDLTSKGTTTLGGTELDINSTKVVYDAGSVSGQIKGYQDLQVLGGNKLAVSGSNSLCVAGDEAHTVVGKKKDLVGDTRETFIGRGDSVEVVAGNIMQKIRIGNYTIHVNTGMISIETDVGSVTVGNSIGQQVVRADGSLEMSGLSFTFTDLLGNVFTVTPAKAELNHMIKASIKSNIEAELIGETKTTVGGSASMTTINGSMIQLKAPIILLGQGGLPVARMIDQCFGIGFAGTPVVSTIISGSTTTFSS